MFRFPRYVAADSGASFLDENYDAINIIATAAVLVEFPYNKPSEVIYQIGPYGLESNGLLREFQVALELAKKVKPDEVHIDSTLGRIKASEISKDVISQLKISETGKKILSSIADEIRSFGLKFENEIGCPAYLIGKESLIVRIAELSAGAVAISYAIEEATQKNRPILIGLPRRSTVIIEKRGKTFSKEVTISRGEKFSVKLFSLIYHERELFGIDPEIRTAKADIVIREFPNPRVNGFNVLLITMKE